MTVRDDACKLNHITFICFLWKIFHRRYVFCVFASNVSIEMLLPIDILYIFFYDTIIIYARTTAIFHWKCTIAITWSISISNFSHLYFVCHHSHPFLSFSSNPMDGIHESWSFDALYEQWYKMLQCVFFPNYFDILAMVLQSYRSYFFGKMCNESRE